MTRIAALVLSLGFALPSHANVSGNRLLEICTSGEVVESGFCQGFIIGVVDALGDIEKMDEDRELLSAFKDVCIPDAANEQQLIDIAVAYLREHPEVRHFSASSNVWVAMSRAFQC